MPYYLFVSLLVTAFVMLLLGIYSRKGIKRNPLYGIRTKLTMQSYHIFTEANRAVWHLYIVNSAILFISSLVVLCGQIFDLDFKISIIAVGIMSILIVGIALLQAYIANRYAGSAEK